VIDADDRRLKSAFMDVMVDDVVHESLAPLLRAQTKKVEDFDVKAQVYVRERNFFHLDENGKRTLIKDASYDETYIRQYPERFSPNALLRPLYQEAILPNLVYIAGPSETRYWFQLKEVFLHAGLSQPLVLPRQMNVVL